MNKWLRLAAVATCVSMAVVFPACESADPSTPLTGEWTIECSYEASTYGSTKSETTRLKGRIQDTNGQLSGIEGGLTGTHSGQDVTFTYDSHSHPRGLRYTIRCSGTYDGNSMSGSCTVREDEPPGYHDQFSPGRVWTGSGQWKAVRNDSLFY